MKMFLILVAVFAAGMCISHAKETGDAVVLIYNSRVPESKEVALHYAERRKVPANQMVGFELPVTEEMTRSDYRTLLERPLLEFLEKKKLFSFKPDLSSNESGAQWKLGETKIRYVVLCYGVPTKILADGSLAEPEAKKLPKELQRNEAAVDSELALLPLNNPKRLLAGPTVNPAFGATNAALLHPTNGILMVARLDGPNAVVARGLVDKAIQAETDGLWGRSYFDLRGVTNEYKVGDDSLRVAAEANYKFGYETILDEKPETFAADFPMSQIAFYAGWYDANVSGPFTKPKVEWMPGAFAYHIHSYSAAKLRTTTENWVGPLLASGATATIGAVDEPYLIGTPDMSAFFTRFMQAGFSFGEAAYASQGALSWQITVVGDPLYRPFARKLQELHEDLIARKSKLNEWAHLRIVDVNIAQGLSLAEAVNYLEAQPITKTSAILTEKLGDLYFAQGKPASANQSYKDALKIEVTPQQKVRLEKWVANTAEAAAKSLEKK